ncbi:protein Peter pan [Diabrotica undecimpunctata]|uniref:protein Peter pan n=1 Tax=Diabrotica undecimpunctata TaxID=50387 RepID=UPI003B641528
MGKKKRGRSVKKNLNQNIESNDIVQAPHSFVIHRGISGGNTLELTKDFRKVMEPFTASSLKERKKNTIKDFVSIAGPLHVSHLSIFSRTELGMYLKIMRLPRGPTLTFKIHNYSLARDVVSSLKKQRVVEGAFKHSPLIVLNSFSGEGLQLKLMASMFQNMFPTINLTNVDLNTVKRCVLMNYNPTTKLIDFRHYSIKVAPVGISRGVKKVVQGKIPNLSRCNDITEFFTKAGMMSESEAEEDPQNHVILAQKIASRGNVESGKSAIRLSELGPRLTLQLIKIEDGLLDGEVLYHELVHKTEEEKEEIQKKREQKRKLKEKRKKVQEANKKAKDDAKQKLKENSMKGILKNKENEESKDAEDEIDKDDDTQYYKEDVGEAPDADLFTSKPGGKRKFEPLHYKNKKRKLDDSDNSQHKNNEKGFKDKRKSSKASFQVKNKFSKGSFKDKKGDKQPFKRKNKFKNQDKTNSRNRDQRPIGGNFANKNKKNFKSKNKRKV